MTNHPTGHDWDSTAAESVTLVFGDRGALYSHPFDDYSRVTEIANAIVPPAHRDTPVGSVLRMVAVKLARIYYGLEADFDPDRLRDSFVDACGYLDCTYGTLIRWREKAIETSGRMVDSDERAAL